MPEHLINLIKKQIKPEWKIAFYSSVIIGVLVHLFVFTNRLMNHDTLHNIYNTQAKVKSGRFFLGPASGMSSYFDLPWVIGVLSILFLAFAVICIVEIFELKKRLSIILVAGIVVSFPSVTATFSYMYTADGYMLGTFLGLLAVLLTKNKKIGFVYGAILLCLSIGVYQANLSVVLAFIIFWLLREILYLKINNKQLLTHTVKFGSMIVLGLGLYSIVYKLYTGLLNVNITSYQGLDKVGTLSLGDVPERLLQIQEQLKLFFFRGFYTFYDVSLFEVLNVIMLTVIVVVTISLIVRHKIYRDLIKLMAVVVLIVSLPFAYFIVYFISPVAFYHMLMLFSLSTLYIYPILIYDTVEPPTKSLSKMAFSWTTVILLSVTIINFGIIANISYFNMEVRYEKSKALANRLLDRIEQLDNYEEIEQLAVIGKAPLYSELASEIIPNRVPAMTGMLGETFLANTYHYTAMLENFLGYKVEMADDEKVMEIKESKEYMDMEEWPAKSSVKSLNHIAIVKFKDE